MKQTPLEIQTLDVRRAVLADADQVRYRVYSSPIEFVAVIAESALMAVKVSGIQAPYKIMRDFPTDGVAIAAKRMAEVKIPQKVTLPIAKVIDKTEGKTELRPNPPTAQDLFVPMDVVALQHKHGPRARILPPDMLYDIIETHVREAMTSPAKPTENPAKLETPPAVESTVSEADAAILSAPTSIPQEQIVTQMADEILPPSTQTPVTTTPEGDSLSSDDVEKLLNDQ